MKNFYKIRTVVFMPAIAYVVLSVLVVVFLKRYVKKMAKETSKIVIPNKSKWQQKLEEMQKMQADRQKVRRNNTNSSVRSMDEIHDKLKGEL